MPRAAPKWIVRCGCVLAVAWPLSIHGAVLLEAAQWGPRLTAIAGALVAAVFVGEYAYRRLRYRNHRHATLLELVASVRSAGLFARK